MYKFGDFFLAFHMTTLDKRELSSENFYIVIMN